MAQIDVIAPALQNRRLAARFARPGADMDRILALRARAFRAGRASDGDAFDARCRHVLIEDATGAVLCALRLLELRDSAQIARSYSAQFYDLSPLRAFRGPVTEMGRFCVDPDHSDPTILRVAWAFLARQVQRSGAKMLFGCSSFAGTEPQDYADTFRLLRARHLGPDRLRPAIAAPEVVRFGDKAGQGAPDIVAAMRAMPPLLRSYLVMGGWVSDHAVIDRDLGTMHVFTGLEIAAIPPARRRFLQGVAPGGPVSG